MAAPARPAKFKTPAEKRLIAVHAERRKRGIDDDTYRDKLRALFPRQRWADPDRPSTKDLDFRQLGALLDAIKGKPGAGSPDTGASHLSATGPVAPMLAKIRALWLSGWHLGVVRDPSDAALETFVKHQTGLGSARWLRSAGDATAVIEGLKAWLARDAGVKWADHPTSRLAVIYAQWWIVSRTYTQPPRHPYEIDNTLGAWLFRQGLGDGRAYRLSKVDQDSAIQRLGPWVRRVRKEDRQW